MLRIPSYYKLKARDTHLPFLFNVALQKNVQSVALTLARASYDGDSIT